MVPDDHEARTTLAAGATGMMRSHMASLPSRRSITETWAMIRIAVVEYDPHVRTAIVARCKRQSDFTAVGDWESADDAA